MTYREPSPHRTVGKRSIFTRPRPRTPAEAAWEKKFREDEHERLAGQERLHTVSDLYEHLSKIPGGAQACKTVFECDPWKYEPLMLDELVRELAQGADPTRLNELRGLIRAGSWMTYERINTDEALARLGTIRKIEEDACLSRVRNADPETSREFKQDLKELMADLAAVADSLSLGKIGADIETATRTIENLNARVWLSLKQMLSAHGLALDQARSRPTFKPMFEEIERLRPVRDLLYFRRVYPSWAAKSLGRAPTKTEGAKRPES